MTERDVTHIAETESRTWRFSCDRCGDIGTCTFTTLEDETEAALNLVRAHDGHGLGGFMTPVKSDG
jgi:hypothetical protein